MASGEAVRHRVFEAFEASHGTEVASDLLELLPPAGVPELATKQDLALLKAELTAEFTELLRAEVGGLRAEFTELLRAEVGGLRAEFTELLRAEVGEVRAEVGGVRGELGDLRGDVASLGKQLERTAGELRTEMTSLVLQQTNRMVRWMLATMTIVGGLAVAVTRAVGAG